MNLQAVTHFRLQRKWLISTLTVNASLNVKRFINNISLDKIIEKCVSNFSSNNDTFRNLFQKYLQKFLQIHFLWAVFQIYQQKLLSIRWCRHGISTSTYLSQCISFSSWAAVVSNYRQYFRPNIYKRYVDFIIVIFKFHEQLEIFA